MDSGGKETGGGLEGDGRDEQAYLRLWATFYLIYIYKSLLDKCIANLFPLYEMQGNCSFNNKHSKSTSIDKKTTLKIIGIFQHTFYFLIIH